MSKMSNKWTQEELMPTIKTMLRAQMVFDDIAHTCIPAGGKADFGRADKLFDHALDLLGVPPDGGDGSRDYLLDLWSTVRTPRRSVGYEDIECFIKAVLDNQKGAYQ